MNTKLTLTVDKSVVEMAKKYAKEKGESLSSMVENYFKFVAAKYRQTAKKEEDIEITPLIESLAGSLKVPDDFDEKEELLKALEEKYM